MANTAMGASAMTHFPRSLIEFQRRFPDERACAAYLARVRWPDGFHCPSCGQGNGWELSSKAFTWELSVPDEFSLNVPIENSLIGV